MKRDDIMAELHQDASAGYGEILNISERGVLYYDYGMDTEVLYQFAESLTDDYVKSLIKIGCFAKETGITEQLIMDVLKEAYFDCYDDAICTLAGIIIPSNEDEYYDMFQSVIRNSYDIKEWYVYGEEVDGKHVGRMYAQHHVIFIDAACIMKKSKEMVNEYDGNDSDIYEEYIRGFIMTLIHEVRHLMLDTNVFLSEKDYPETLAEEDAVEEFTISAYEKLPKVLREFIAA